MHVKSCKNWNTATLDLRSILHLGRFWFVYVFDRLKKSLDGKQTVQTTDQTKDKKLLFENLQTAVADLLFQIIAVSISGLQNLIRRLICYVK